MTATVLEPAITTRTDMQDMRQAQAAWAATPLAERLRILRLTRHELARIGDRLVDAISPSLSRTRADSYGSEVLPLLAACRFLEQEAARILKPRRLGLRRRPFWLARIDSTVERVPFGVVLIIAPANYPLLLAGVQTLQALAAGNAVVWKPGRDSVAVAQVFAAAMYRAGLPDRLLEITDESTETAIAQLKAGPDKVFFTGSGAAGRAVLRMAADQAIPVVAELSGCDAVIVLPSADPSRVVEALTWGMRLNGSSTCIAPRRMILVGDGHDNLIESLLEHFAATPGIELNATTRDLVERLTADAERHGATILGNSGNGQPILVLNGRPEMEIAQADVFAPVLTVLHASTPEDVPRLDSLCPFGLTAAIFGDEKTARALGAKLNVGSVLVNDIIFPTVDPRVPFGGRRGSGFGTTRGAEGLLEMTAAKVTAVSKDKLGLHYQPTGPAHEEIFRAAIALVHSRTLRQRAAGLRNLVTAARKL
jgi:aldehyde dehydrogenase (NAD+)